ncbi:MAG TPA: hypothetical protein VM899_15355 [Rubellimicrobium sp.]|nr:hypothetical protein [Rubellimicrobium sp.]
MSPARNAAAAARELIMRVIVTFSTSSLGLAASVAPRPDRFPPIAAGVP